MANFASGVFSQAHHVRELRTGGSFTSSVTLLFLLSVGAINRLNDSEVCVTFTCLENLSSQAGPRFPLSFGHISSACRPPVHGKKRRVSDAVYHIHQSLLRVFHSCPPKLILCLLLESQEKTWQSYLGCDHEEVHILSIILVHSQDLTIEYYAPCPVVHLSVQLLEKGDLPVCRHRPASPKTRLTRLPAWTRGFGSFLQLKMPSDSFLPLPRSSDHETKLYNIFDAAYTSNISCRNTYNSMTCAITCSMHSI
jgi:hypothetical protein